MKLSKIIIASLVGTSFMTLYSYYISKKEKQEFTEPVLLNKLIDRSENLPEIENKEEDSHPAGWLLHFGTGVGFMLCYYFLYKKALTSPSLSKGLLLGSASGLVGIGVWKIMFASNNNPPRNNRYRYYRQLFIAHIIFSTFAIYGYKLPEYSKAAFKKLT